MMNRRGDRRSGREVRRAAQAGVRRRPRCGGSTLGLPGGPSARPPPSGVGTGDVALGLLAGENARPAEGSCPGCSSTWMSSFTRGVIRHGPVSPLYPCGRVSRAAGSSTKAGGGFVGSRDGVRSGAEAGEIRNALLGPPFTGPKRKVGYIFCSCAAGVSPHRHVFDPKDKQVGRGKLNRRSRGSATTGAGKMRPASHPLAARTFARHGPVGHPGLRLVSPHVGGA